MSKKVLAIYFTQSGQMEDIINHFTQPLLSSAGLTLEKLRIYPATAYPFPWTTPTFFDVMPESVITTPVELKPLTFKEERYDLIIIGYQPWFLSPSLPISSILQHPSFKTRLQNTPVITISGCRNMWINAQEKMKKLLSEASAHLVGNIALVDRHNNYASLVTIFYWMLTGKKDRKWGIFPRPGVSDKDIEGAAVFGETVRKHIDNNNLDDLQPALIAQQAVVIQYPLMFIERKAGKIFSIWSRIIHGSKKRKVLLVAFKYYLLIALCVAAPIILLVDAIFFKPFLGRRIRNQVEYYQSVRSL